MWQTSIVYLLTFLLQVFGVSFCVIAFFLSSNLYVYVGFVVADRVLYLPSYGENIDALYGSSCMTTASLTDACLPAFWWCRLLFVSGLRVAPACSRHSRYPSSTSRSRYGVRHHSSKYHRWRLGRRSGHSFFCYSCRSAERYVAALVGHMYGALAVELHTAKGL